MSPQSVNDAAMALVEARRTGATLRALPAALAPQTAADAYAIQDAVAHALGGVAGWKVGAKGLAAEPNCAPIPLPLLHASPHRFEAAQLRLRGIEAEFAFRFVHDLPPRARPYERDEVAAAVASVHGAIELVESRFEDIRTVDPLSLLADGNSHGALVVGAGVAAIDEVDSTRARVGLSFDDKTVAETTGGNPAGDVWRLLTWLANHCAARGGGLRADQIVTTGSCTGLQFAPAGTRVTVAIEGLPPVRVDV
ncbi:MAG TPA: fumarylacetoacetate hydrolase family protein [Burkholderiaceae bacterium]|nr:fumarylacetoacetate hydrolase family protein [Burkholderiaceae bacterium]